MEENHSIKSFKHNTPDKNSGFSQACAKENNRWHNGVHISLNQMWFFRLAGSYSEQQLDSYYASQPLGAFKEMTRSHSKPC